MPIDRLVWRTTFVKERFAQLPCPSCERGRLRLDDETLAEGDTDETFKDRARGRLDYETVEGRFAAILPCGYCHETVSVAGEYGVDTEGPNRQDEWEYYNYYVPKMFWRAPHIFSIPKTVPKDISAEVIKAFELYWCDPSASANRIRTSIEMLLTHLKVPRTTITKKHQREPLSLSSRIDKLNKVRPSLHDEFVGALTAIRYVGNAGSHVAGLTHSDVLDAMELLDHIFQELFVAPRKRIARMTKEITRRKKPRSH